MTNEDFGERLQLVEQQLDKVKEFLAAYDEARKNQHIIQLMIDQRQRVRFLKRKHPE